MLTSNFSQLSCTFSTTRFNNSINFTQSNENTIKHWKPNAVPRCTSASSVTEFERMLRTDKRDPKAVGIVIRWLFCEYQPAPGSDFDWRSNVMSGKKLRAHFDRLEDLMERSGTSRRENMTGR